MTRQRFCTCARGLVAPLVTALFLPAGSLGSVLVQLTPNAEATSSVQQAVMLLERLQTDQQALREAINRLQLSQEIAFEREARALRDQHKSISARLAEDRDLQMESLNALGQVALTIVLAVTGVLLFAMGAVAWGLLRAFQRLPVRALGLPQVPTRPEVAGLTMLPDTQLANALAMLEKRILKLGETAARQAAVSASGRTTPLPMETPAALPGDFL